MVWEGGGRVDGVGQKGVWEIEGAGTVSLVVGVCVWVRAVI